MSTSLRLRGGDLVLSNRSLDTVSGHEKLFQDLTLNLLEKVGNDPSTPTYGSRLDGAFLNGAETNPFIGQMLNEQLTLALRAEIVNVLTRYQAAQLEKMKSEAYMFNGKHTLNSSEVIYSIDDITTTTIGTTVIAQVTITTLANQQVSLTIPVTN